MQNQLERVRREMEDKLNHVKDEAARRELELRVECEAAQQEVCIFYVSICNPLLLVMCL